MAADKVGPRFLPHPVSPLASGVTSDGVEGRGNGRGEEKAPPGQTSGDQGGEAFSPFLSGSKTWALPLFFWGKPLGLGSLFCL